MTVEEKRERVFAYCANTKCVDCVLTKNDWKTSNDFGCMAISIASEEELDRALEIITEVSEHCTEPEPCVLEPAAEDAEIVIKIKSSRKINCLHIEFAEEE